ncbi:MAG: transcriptional repressor [Candidatus Aminicenantes bacterium]|nr:transcriptional repressor [Candidatus Aminicenantes bacterium]
MNLKDCHPSAEMIYGRVHEENPHISFDTVNRTLLKFAEIGIVDILKGISGPRRFDPGDREHHHIFCEGCGAIIDFDHEEYDNISVPEEIQQKYQISGKRMVLSGLCEKCIRVKNI